MRVSFPTEHVKVLGFVSDASVAIHAESMVVWVDSDGEWWGGLPQSFIKLSDHNWTVDRWEPLPTRDVAEGAGIGERIDRLTATLIGTDRPHDPATLHSLRKLLFIVRDIEKRPCLPPKPAPALREFSQWLETRTVLSESDGRSEATEILLRFRALSALVPQAVKLTPREQWYLAETIANCIGQTLVDDPEPDIIASPPVRGDREAIAIEQRVIPGREDWFLLAHELSEARDAYLNGMGQQGSAARRMRLEEILWNDKGTFIQVLQAMSLSLPVQPGAGEREAVIRECIVAASVADSGGIITPGGMRSAIIASLRTLSRRQAPHSSSETE